MSTHWANLPAFGAVILGVAGIGGLQGGVHYLFHGENPRPILRDNFDFMMERRDARLEKESIERARLFAEAKAAAKEAEQAAQE
mmetsp:Transcript_5809/g.11930  ORF Transcript_5809/g.11930 Transcript_5809/m.11930 type:complete len:84 (+) Transcript_5809:165-416(+)